MSLSGESGLGGLSGMFKGLDEPSDIFPAGRTNWWRADSGVTGTTNVTAWLDKTSGVLLNNVSSSRGPSLSSAVAAANNMPGLVFSRAENDFLVANFRDCATDKATIYVVGSIGTGYTDQAFFDWGVNSSFAAGISSYYGSGKLNLSVRDTTTTRVAQTAALTLPLAHAMYKFVYQSGSMKIYQNGTEIATSSTVGSLLNVLNRFTIGIMGNQTSYGLNGTINEVIVYDDIETAQQTEAMARYRQVVYNYP